MIFDVEYFEALIYNESIKSSKAIPCVTLIALKADKGFKILLLEHEIVPKVY